MTQNSLISQYMYEHENWREELKANYNLSINEKDGKVIFNYGIGADFSEPIVQEARGIIINVETLDVVCWPFRKFGNWNESYADQIDWEYAWATKKIDGSLIKLYYDFWKNGWVFATNGTIYATDANVGDGDMTFWDVVHKATNYYDLEWKRLDKDYTYMFELVSPWTQVVIKYQQPFLYHIGTRNNITGKEYNIDIGIEKPESIKIASLDAAVQGVEVMNQTDVVTEEGYVVADKNWNRIKVKSPKYLMMHSQLNNRVLTKKRLVNDIFLDKEVVASDLRLEAKYFFYKYKIAELAMQVDIFIDYVRALYEEVSRDRYAVYEAIKDHPLAQFGLKSIEHDVDAKSLIEEMYINRRDGFLRLLPDYEIDFDGIIKGTG